MGTRTLTVKLQANIAGLRAGLSAGAAEVRAFGKDVGDAALSTSQHTDRLGRGFLIAGGIIGAALGASVFAATQFEASMRNVATISDYVGAHFEETGTKILAMSNRLPQSANELAQGLYDVASSGFAGRDGMVVLEASAKAASAGLSDTATSGRAITGVLNAYGLGAKDAASVSDVLFQTVNLGVITFDELAQNLGDVVGLAAQMKVPIKDVGTAIATITLAGIPAAEATTALNRVMLSFIQPSDAMIEQLHALGYESGQQAIEQDGLRVVMTKLRGATGDNIAAFQALFPEVRGLKGALALTAAEGENYTRVAKGMGSASDGAGATQRALSEQSKSLQYQLGILKNNVVNLGIEFGGTLLPALKIVGAGAKDIVSTFASMPGPMRTAVVVLGALSAAALLVGGSFLLLFSRIGRMRAELLNMGPAGARAALAMTALGRGIALASGAALAAYGFSALDGSLEGTITGVLSLLTAVSLLKAGLPGLQSGLAAVSERLTASAVPGAMNLGVAFGNLGAATGRLGQVLPTLAISGAVAASTMDDMGKASLGGALNMAAMAATGAQLGFVVGGPVGAAIGGFIGLVSGPLASALGVGGESVDEYRSKFDKLATTLDDLTEIKAAIKFQDMLGRDDSLDLSYGKLRAIKDELQHIAHVSPDAARKIVQGMGDARSGIQLTAADQLVLNRYIDDQITLDARRNARRADAKAANDAIRDSHKEVAAAAGLMSEAEQKAAEESAKAIQSIASAATSALPTAKGAFEEIQAAAANFGVTMDPAVLLQGFQEKLKAELDFGSSVTTIMQAGFLDIGNVIAQEGPEKGAQIAKSLADGIKAGDPTITAQLNETAKLIGVVGPTFEEQFRTQWAPRILAGGQAAFAQLSPYVRGLLGIQLPADIDSAAPAVLASSQRVALGFSGPWNLVPPAVTGKGREALEAAKGVFAGGVPDIFAGAVQAGAAVPSGFSAGTAGMGAAGAAAGTQATTGLQGGVAGMPGVVGAAGAGATGELDAQGQVLGATAAGAGQGATNALGQGLSGMPGLTGAAVANAAISFIVAAQTLAGTAFGVGAGVGSSFSSGVASGIAAGSGAVTAAAAGVVAKAEAAARAKADAQSPSQLFARLGRDLASGVELGIMRGTPEAVRAASGLVEAPRLPVFARGAALARAGATVGGSSTAALGGSGSSMVVNVTSVIEGNVYGDDAFKSKVKESQAESNRKLATAMRRNRG